MLIEKAFSIKSLEPLDIDAALAQINRFSRRPVQAEDVYVGKAELANDVHDRSGERFPPAYLQRFAETIVGAPVLEAHDKRRSGVGRWFGAAVEKDAGGTSRLITDFYLDARSDLARRVDLGIASEVSIGVRVPKGARLCDLDGKSYEDGCQHQVLQRYGEQVCTLTYGGDVSQVHADEGSFVGIGCQYGAQVVRSKLWVLGGSLLLDKDDADPPETAVLDSRGKPADPEDGMEKAELEARVKVLEDENQVLKQDAAYVAEGKAFTAYLLEQITKSYGILQEDPAGIVKLLSTANSETLREHYDGLLKRIDAKFPPTPVSKQLGEGADLAPPPEGTPKPKLPFDPYANLRGGV